MRHASVQHAEGIHARPAEQIARLATQYSSEVILVRDSQRVDAKSILSVLTLGAHQGIELIVEAIGPDAEDAVEAVAQLVQSDFPVESPTDNQ